MIPIHSERERKRKPPRTIAVIGGGAVGTSVLVHLIDELCNLYIHDPVRIVVLEKSGAPGPGLAYQADSAPYLLNRTAETMSVVHGKIRDFHEWIQGNSGDGQGLEGQFLKREMFGRYLRDRFQEARKRAQEKGVEVEVVPFEAVSVQKTADGVYRIDSSDGARCNADYVVFCLGNLPSRKFRALLNKPGFFNSPYPSAKFSQGLRADARVGILGARLSAVDTVMALASDGHQGPIHLAARQAMLPSLRSTQEQHRLQRLTAEQIRSLTNFGRRKLRLAEVVGLLAQEVGENGSTVNWNALLQHKADPIAFLRSELEESGRGPRKWQNVGVALNEVIELLWTNLAPEDQKLFLDEFYSLVMSYRVPIPRENGQRLLKLLESGQVSVSAGLDRVEHDPRTRQFVLHRTTGEPVRCDVLINATGSVHRLADCASDLVADLLRSGLASEHSLGGMRVDFETSRLIRGDGQIEDNAFAVGNLTFGTHLFTSVLELNVRKAYEIARQIATEVFHHTLMFRERESYVHAYSHLAENAPFHPAQPVGVAHSLSHDLVHVSGE